MLSFRSQESSRANEAVLQTADFGKYHLGRCPKVNGCVPATCPLFSTLTKAVREAIEKDTPLLEASMPGYYTLKPIHLESFSNKVTLPPPPYNKSFPAPECTAGFPHKSRCYS